ncbi:ABC transporter permease [Paenibacillus sp. N1-5-1-14]|nr:oligopeptide ABC transporter permease [Paenibacillus radicibacter]MCR8644785.1 ABC transporter permease [Paenibacillus radicibacter]
MNSYNKEVFEPADDTNLNPEKITTKSLTSLQDSWIRFRQNKVALVGLIIIIFLIFMAIFGPYMNKWGFDDQQLTRAKLPPKVPFLENIPWLGFNGHDIQGVDQYAKKGVTDYFWFGTDELGRDLWTRIWEGTRISLFIAVLAACIDVIIGVAYGAISAFYGGKVDNVMQRICEVLVGIPSLIIVILLILVLKPGILTIVLAMVMTGWVGMSRIVRGQILKLRDQEYVLAARTLGAKDKRLMFRHLIPNSMGPIIVTSMFTIPGAIFTEAFLSFIGLGLQPPTASLGTIINDGYKLMRIYPHMLIMSSVVISLIMISFNMLGDGLRDALDPKMRR